MVTRRETMAALGAGLGAGAVALAGGLGFPLGPAERIDAPYDDVRLGDVMDGTLFYAASGDDRAMLVALDLTDREPAWFRRIDGPSFAPVYADGRVWSVADGELLAVDAGGGAVETVTSPPTGTFSPPDAGSGVVAASHTAVERSDDVMPDQPDGTLYAVDGDGVRWTSDHFGRLTRPAVGDGNAYVTVSHREGRDLEYGRVSAVDLGSGHDVWTSADVEAVRPPTVTPAGVVVPGRDGAVRRLDPATGDVSWRVELDGAPRAVAAGIRDDEVVVTLEDAVVGVDAAAGTTSWRYGAPAAVHGAAVVDDVVLVQHGSSTITALRPHGDGEAWRGTVGDVRWPPVRADGSLYLGGRDGTIHVRDGVALAARDRLERLEDGGLPSVLDPLADLLGYDAERDRAERALDGGDPREAYRAAGSARLRRWAAGIVAGTGVLAALAAGGYAVDLARRRRRRQRAVRRRHREAAERVEDVERAVDGRVPALRDAIDDAEPGPITDPEEVRRRLDRVEREADRVRAIDRRRRRSAELVDELATRVDAADPPFPVPLDELRERLDDGDPRRAEALDGVGRCESALEDVTRVTRALGTVDLGWLDDVVPLETGPLDGVRPTEVYEALERADGLEGYAAAARRLGGLTELDADEIAEDGRALAELGDEALAERYAGALRRADVEELRAARRRLRGRRRIADRRASLAERLDDVGDRVGGLATDRLEETVDGVDPDDVAGALERLDLVDRALTAAERLDALADRGVPVAFDEARATLRRAVDDVDLAAVEDVERTIDDVERTVERAADVLQRLEEIDLRYADMTADEVRRDVAEAVADRQLQRLERLDDRLQRIRDGSWSTRELRALDDDGFAALVADLWSSFGYDVARREDVLLARGDAETVAIAPCVVEAGRRIRRRDVEHHLDRSRELGADRLLVVANGDVSSGALATADHGWSDVAFVDGDELADMLTESRLAPPATR